MRRAAVLVSLIALAPTGCRFELTEVEVDPDGAEAFLRIATGGTSEGGLILAASFHPGATADGSVRGADDDSLRLDGRGIAASEQQSDGTRLYRVEWSAGDSPGGPLRLRGPVVPDILEPPPEIGVRTLRFEVPDTLVVVSGQAVSIALAGLGSGAPLWGIDAATVVPVETRRTSWSLQVRVDPNGPPVLRLEGRSPPPALFTFDAGLLPSDLVGARIELQAQIEQTFTTEGGGYEIEVYRPAVASVPIRLTPP
jgi:hypothetical protein